MCICHSISIEFQIRQPKYINIFDNNNDKNIEKVKIKRTNLLDPNITNLKKVFENFASTCLPGGQ